MNKKTIILNIYNQLVDKQKFISTAYGFTYNISYKSYNNIKDISKEVMHYISDNIEKISNQKEGNKILLDYFAYTNINKFNSLVKQGIWNKENVYIYMYFLKKLDTHNSKKLAQTIYNIFESGKDRINAKVINQVLKTESIYNHFTVGQIETIINVYNKQPAPLFSMAVKKQVKIIKNATVYLHHKQGNIYNYRKNINESILGHLLSNNKVEEYVYFSRIKNGKIQIDKDEPLIEVFKLIQYCKNNNIKVENQGYWIKKAALCINNKKGIDSMRQVLPHLDKELNLNIYKHVKAHSTLNITTKYMLYSIKEQSALAHKVIKQINKENI